MVFNFREAIAGFRHLRLKWTRVLAQRPDSYFVPDYRARGLAVQQFFRPDGAPAVCEVCGFSMLRLRNSDGWLFEFCSAMPCIRGLESDNFGRWMKSLNRAKLPIAHR